MLSTAAVAGIAALAWLLFDQQTALLAAAERAGAIVERLYIATLARKPTPQEVETFKPIVASQADLKKNLDDLFWAVLNSREFIFNH